MKTITITKYKDQKDNQEITGQILQDILKEGVSGAWKYWHLIQFKEDGYKYDLNATDECCGQIISIFRAAGHTVIFEEK